MNKLNNEPVLRASIADVKRARKEKKLFLSPQERLDPVESLVVDLALNGTLSAGSVLPDEYTRLLLESTVFFYQVSETSESPVFDRIIMVIDDTHVNKISIYTLDKDTDTYNLKDFTVLTPEIQGTFITNNLSKTVYFEEAARLKDDRMYQYQEDMADVYKLLFYVTFQTELVLRDSIEDIESRLVAILENTEITLHLNITRTIKLYGNLDDEGFLNLNIREIGTPDTFWTRSVHLREVLLQLGR